MKNFYFKKPLFFLLISLLTAVTPQNGLRYILNNRGIFKFEKLEFTLKGIEMEVSANEIPAIYSHRREIGFEKAEVLPSNNGMWRVVLRFKKEGKNIEGKPAVKREEKLTEREAKTVEILKRERERTNKKKVVIYRNKGKQKNEKISIPPKGKTPERIDIKSNQKSSTGNPWRKIKPQPHKLLNRGKTVKNDSALPERFRQLPAEARKAFLKPVSVAFKGVPLIAFLDFLSQRTGISVIPVGKLSTKLLNLFIENTPLFKVVEIVMMQNGLSVFIESKNILIVGPIKKIEEMKKNRKLISTLEAGENVVKVLRVKNANISKVKLTLKDIFGSTLKISEIKESRIMVIKGPEKIVRRAEEIVKNIDHPRAQILVQAKVIEISENEIKNLGIRWMFEGVSPAGANGTPFTLKSSPGLPPVNGNSRDTVRAPIERPVFSQSFKIGVPYNIASLELSLSSLEKKGKAKVVAEPSVTLEEGTEGQILQTKEIPYSYVNNWLANVSFRQAGLILKVTPYIVDIRKKLVKLKVKVESSTPDFGNPVNGLPPIDRQGVEVVNVIKDGEFQILGGLKVKRTSSSKNGVPILSSIPLVKHLFKNSDRRSDNYELLILIRPKIQLM